MLGHLLLATYYLLLTSQYFVCPNVTLYGYNGSGKTTTIHLLLGLLQPTNGSANVLGFDIQTQGTEIRARTGVLLEHTGLYERLNAEDNLEFYGRIYRLPEFERRSRIKELLSYSRTRLG